MFHRSNINMIDDLGSSQPSKGERVQTVIETSWKNEESRSEALTLPEIYGV